jgi:hypothetical protein
VNATGTDIDHLVIGPGGVFSLNTKNHSGRHVWIAERTFMVNGQRQQYLRISRSEGKKVSRILSKECKFPVPVRAVIVVLADRVTIKGGPTDVHVEPYETIRFWLRRQPVMLNNVEVARIYDVARKSETWLGV